jgi:hypothetical protein
MQLEQDPNPLQRVVCINQPYLHAGETFKAETAEISIFASFFWHGMLPVEKKMVFCSY